MVCRVVESAAHALWSPILELRRFLRSPNAEEAFVAYLLQGEQGWSFSTGGRDFPDEGLEHVVALPLDGSRELDSGHLPSKLRAGVSAYLHGRFREGEEPFAPLRGELPSACRTFLRVYLPIVLGGFHARLESRLFVTAHLAQTLDGRIACHNGHSQWISNQANLHHAHRLRALHDGVIVGGQTVRNDDPELTVRHVEGDHPRRIVLNASASLLGAGGDYKVFAGHGSLVLCRESAFRALPSNGKPSSVDVVPIPGPDQGLLGREAITEALVQRGIRSAFLEGGGRTLSGFLDQGAIDLLHVHVAPVILGSGIHGFSLPRVNTIQAGRHLKMEHFAFDGELLFECRDRQPEGSGSASR